MEKASPVETSPATRPRAGAVIAVLASEGPAPDGGTSGAGGGGGGGGGVGVVGWGGPAPDGDTSGAGVVSRYIPGTGASSQSMIRPMRAPFPLSSLSNTKTMND